MIKPLILTAAVLGLNGLTLFAEAGDPVWLQQKTEQRYDIKVYRAANCGCCKGWIEHLQEHNFNVEDLVVDSVDPIKQQYQVPAQAASCHTAIVNGKVIEGHVPAQEIKKLLASSSDIRLLAVPGMPSGGPGMDWEGARKDPFTVYGLSDTGKVTVFKDYPSY